MKEKHRKARLQVLDRIAFGITLIALVALGMMRRVHFATDMHLDFIPPLNAAINTIVAIALILARIKIKRKEVAGHRKLMKTAMVLSLLFFVLYLAYHFTTPETQYCYEDWTRTVYFLLLVSHILLAAIVLPFILMSFNRAITGHIEMHRKMVKWTFPLWLYVAVSGPLVYWMLRNCY